MARKRKSLRHDDNWIGKICIGFILIVFMIVMSVQIKNVYEKDQEKIAEEAELQQLLVDELERQQELKEYQEYVDSTEYVEDVAESKLGLLYENQVIFRESEE